MYNDRGRKLEENLRTERVVVHVTEEEKKIFIKLAKENGMDVSTFIRTVCIYNQFEKLCNSMVKGVF